LPPHLPVIAVIVIPPLITIWHLALKHHLHLSHAQTKPTYSCIRFIPPGTAVGSPGSAARAAH
jgi:hypothetical protein